MIPAGLKIGEADEDELEKGKQESRDENTNPPAKNSATHRLKMQRHGRRSRGSSPSVALLMERIRDYFDGADPQDSDAELDPALALQLLEASSGDIDMAAAFFWDNYLASASRLPQAKVEQDVSTSGKRKRSDASSTGSARAAARRSPHHHDSEEENVKVRPIRQRLEGRFNREDEYRADDNHPINEGLPAPPVAAVNNNNQVDFEDAMEGAGEMPAADANPDAMAGSVSVSDDEGAGIWRTERRRRQAGEDDDALHRNVGLGRLTRSVSNGADLPPVNDGADNDDSSRASQIRESVNGDSDIQTQAENDDDEAYLSDDDWLTGKSTSTTTPQPPSKNLWGLSSTESSHQGTNHVSEELQNLDIAPCTSKIPETWLYAGFGVDDRGGGLVLKPPTEEDVVFNRWKQQQNTGAGDTRNVALPPFHCKALTAILAVVNATMLTGASIQGDCVDCSSARIHFAELSEKDRIREFDSRLGDAIAAILYVALKASTTRKQRAIEARAKQNSCSSQGNGDFEQMQRQMVARRLRLCPTCRWHEDPSVGEARLAEARDTSVVEVITSFTNVSDLRSFVKSNMRYFSGKRGCALLLENVIRIHGKGTVERLVRKSRQKCGLPVRKGASLIKCTCELRQGDLRLSKAPCGTMGVSNLDTTPPGHECLSIELFSLLVCGEVHSSFKGWSSGCLGFGILSSEAGEIGDALTKPPKPVWILRGDTCHSVLWVDSAKQPVFDLDQQGAVLHMSHWNPWYGIRNQSGFRVNMMRGEWSPPVISQDLPERDNDLCIGSMALRGIWQRKQQVLLLGQSNIVSSDERDDESSQAITVGELNGFHVNEDDQLFYPNDYRRWRYRFRETSIYGVWKSYHRLNDRERRIVEMKLAPRINQILWSRWPNSIVDRFTPEGESLPIV